MPKSCAKKLAVNNNTFVLVTDSKKDTKKTLVVWDLEIVKYIIWNVKLNGGNKEVYALQDLGSKANFIS